MAFCPVKCHQAISLTSTGSASFQPEALAACPTQSPNSPTGSTRQADCFFGGISLIVTILHLVSQSKTDLRFLQ